MDRPPPVSVYNPWKDTSPSVAPVPYVGFSWPPDSLVVIAWKDQQTASADTVWGGTYADVSFFAVGPEVWVHGRQTADEQGHTFNDDHPSIVLFRLDLVYSFKYSPPTAAIAAVGGGEEKAS